MRKHLFLIVIVGTLIIFTACKKENMIIGKWELVSVEGIDDVPDDILPKGFVFEESYYYAVIDFSMFDGWSDNQIIYGGRYYIDKNTITYEQIIGE
jgi:hypothetical protein